VAGSNGGRREKTGGGLCTEGAQEMQKEEGEWSVLSDEFCHVLQVEGAK